MSAPSYYTLLGLAADASAEDLRQAFRRLSKRYHPDTTDLPASQAASTTSACRIPSRPLRPRRWRIDQSR